jgi:hypothetical protein
VQAGLGHGEQIARFESASGAKNGRPIAVSVRVSPVMEGDGRIVGGPPTVEIPPCKRASAPS